MIRSSPDGRRWEPSVSMADVWNRNGRKAAIPNRFLKLPDAEDPPDLEFYSGNGFWYHDRAYMTVLNYAASPLMPRKHGPRLDNEWWTSRDGLAWERPARGVNVLEVFPQVPRLETHPLVLNSTILLEMCRSQRRSLRCSAEVGRGFCASARRTNRAAPVPLDWPVLKSAV